MATLYDVLIIGGGMVGASLAHALTGTGLRIGVVEAHALDATRQPSYDDRVIALAWGSRRILDGMGVWSTIAPEAEPIRHIHISERGHFGFAHLDAEEERVEALGYVVAARDLGQALLAGLDSAERVDLLCPAQLHAFTLEPDRVRVEVREGDAARSLETRLMVAADGGDSVVRRLLGIPVQEWSYGQTAIISNVTPERPHEGIAFERFTDTGPLAMLPMTEGRCSLVWTARDAQVEEIMGWDDGHFLAQLQDRFGYRLGRLLKTGRRVAYPLKRLRVKAQVRRRVVLIGNAAHAVHPVSGQGFNLGIRDVAALADLLAEAARKRADPGAAALLGRYAEWRRGDQRIVAAITDTLARVFTNPLPPVRWARDCGLLGLDLCPPLKHRTARRFMGLNGQLPRLARGLPVA